MPISPCNTLNVKTIRISQLASISSIDLNDSDVIYLSQYDNINNVYYSKKTTLSDLGDYLNIRGNYSGSFSGSFTGKILSKNTIASGSFSGSYWGRINSKNTKATGSFSGSISGNLISKNSKLTGSFRGIDNISNFKGTGIGVSFNGTSSYSVSSSYAEKSDFSATTNSALTSSYLLKTPVNSENFIPVFDSVRLKSSPDLKLYNLSATRRILYYSSSLSRADFIVTSEDATNLELYNLRRTGDTSTYPNLDGIAYTVSTSGSFSLAIPSGSYQINNSGIKAGSKGNEVYMLMHRRNCLFFWPYMSTNAAARDAGIGIGVQPPNSPSGSASQYLRAKLQINMFSGSNEGSFPGGSTGIENKPVAILVNYGSGSVNTGYSTKFYVSSSGDTYVGGTLSVQKALTSSLSTVSGPKTFANDGTSKFIPISVGGTVYYLPLYT